MENDVTERMVTRMFFLGQNFVSSLICTLNLKTLKNKNLGFFQPCRCIWCSVRRLPTMPPSAWRH